MTDRDRAAFARKNAIWLGPLMGVVLLYGILRGNIFAIFAGIFGLVWVARATWKRK